MARGRSTWPQAPRCGGLVWLGVLAGLVLGATWASSARAESAVAVAAGEHHACVVTTGGAAECWGGNDSGELGNGATGQSNVPVAVSGLGSGVAAIATGQSHTCALTTGGSVLCWGSDFYGQLGDGGATDSRVPVAVSGLGSGVAAVATGNSHSCAVGMGGGVLCWGRGTSGQLGNGSTASSSVPVAVTGLPSGVAAIAAGASHSCALTAAGGVLCWGDNTWGQLGDGTTSPSSVPVAVSGLASGVAAIAAGGSHTCALTTGGAALCWGFNLQGQLGDGTTSPSSVPVAVSGLASGVAAITASQVHTCALTAVGGALCWGFNYFGELGDGTTTGSNVPLTVSGLASGVVAIEAGDTQTCTVISGGALVCWGDDRFGQLGIGSGALSTIPVGVSGLASGVSAVAGARCAVTSDGGAVCWGNNLFGELGNGTTTDSNVPVAVSGLASGVAAIAVGGHTCALTTGGGALCWGYNEFGQLGDGTTTDSSVPVAVSGLASGVAVLVAGAIHTCALTTAGGMLCWGDNSFEQLGDGTAAAMSSVPVAVSGLASGVAAIAAGSAHTCAVTGSGGALCWGYNYFGQLGDGTTTESNVPIAVSGLGSGVAAVSAGESHTCALTASGSVLCWGDNRFGQLGDGTTTESHVPVGVSGLAGQVTAISAGGNHTCALTVVGGVLCWGHDNYGQLGDGTASDSDVPIPVSGLASGATAIAAGYQQTCALTASGGVLCWGDDSRGQLGDGYVQTIPLPTAVVGFDGSSGGGSPGVPAMALPARALLATLLGLAGAAGRRRVVQLDA